MATLGSEFYTSESDITAKDNFNLQDADVFIMKVEDEDTGVESESVNDITLTPTVSPAYATDAYNSTVGLNLLVQGAANTLWYGPVKDTTATTIVFDCTAMFNVSTGAAGTAGDFLTGASYSYRVHTPDAYGLYGSWLGHVKELKLTFSEDVIDFIRGVPREKIVTDTLGWTYDIEGKNFTPSKALFRAIMNGTSYGSQTSQNETHFGFAPSTRAQYKVALIGQNRAGKQMLWEFFLTQFSANGDVDFSAEEYKGLPFKLGVYKDALRQNGMNAFRLQVDE